jgi:polar amino acid transport system substrate-binding protein
MNQRSVFSLAILLVLALLLVACEGQVQEAIEEAAPTIAAAATEVAPTLEAAATEISEAVEEEISDGLPDLGGREVTIAIENQYLPFNYISPTSGEPEGWDYDAWDAICELLNCVPVYIEASWEGMIQAVADGQYDAAADGITITEERAEIVDFSDGYINIEQRLLVRVDEDRVNSIEDVVNDESIIPGTQTGTTNYETAIQYLDPDRIQGYETFPFAVQALLAGDVDVVFMDETAGQGYVGVNADQLKLVGESLSSDSLGFIYPKGSDLVEPVNLALAELKDNGRLEELAVQYFTDAFVITYDDLFPEEEEEAGGLPDLEGREVTIAIENQYLPFNYIDPSSGEPEGWDYDAWDAICELLNCVPVYIEASWEGMIQAVADGQYDAAADGITITEERAEIVDFSDGYINIEQRLLVRVDEDRINSIEDVVNDESIIPGTQTGTTNYETAIQYLDPDRIQGYETFPFAVQALLAGDVDVVFMDETAGQGYVGVNADQLKLVGESLSSDSLGFIYPLGSDLVEPVNLALAELRANGTLEELAVKYFTDAFTITYDDLE